MEQKFSAEELEVAQMLVTLPRLVLEADHRPPCTHNLRWGAKGKRSACGDEPSAAPPLPPPLPQPVELPRAAEKLSRKRGKDRMGVAILKVQPSVEAAQGSGGPCEPPPSLPPPRKVVRPEDRRGDRQEEAPNAVVAGTPERSATAAAPETSSPETPLEFCPSGEEPEAKAKSTARPPPTKRPRLMKHEELSKQRDQLNRTRTELQQEAAEIRNRLQALRERNSQLTHLRKKLEEDADHRREQPEVDEGLRQRSSLDLLPMGPVRPVAAALAPEHVKQQHYQHAWPQHWVNSHVVVGQLSPEFSVHPSSAPAPVPAAGSQHWNWVWWSDGDKGCSGASRLPDLNSAAEKDPEMETQQQHGYYYCDHRQLQLQQRRSSPEEQREARKKRIEMIQKRRNAATAAAALRTPV